MARPPDYYAILGVERGADPRELKRAWRQAARDHHPDLPGNQGDESQHRFKLVKEAYDVLSDPTQRARYDQWWDAAIGGRKDRRESWSEGPTVRPRAGRDFDLQTGAGQSVADIFANLFSEDAPAQPTRPPRGGGGLWDPSNLEAGAAEAQRTPRFDAETLGRAAFGGVENEVTEEAFEPDHRGTSRGPSDRWVDPDDARYTDRGDGTWEARSSRRQPPTATRGEDLPIDARLPFLTAVRGGVLRVHVRLPDPGGAWKVEVVDLPIPPATEEGLMIRMPQRGHFPLGEGSRGDLVVSVIVEDHPVFRRDGADILAELPLSPSEAAAGCRLQVPTVEGSSWVQVPPGVQSGQRVRLRNLGLALGGGERGAQVMMIHVHVPTGLTPTQVDTLRSIEAAVDFHPRRGRWDL